MDKLEDLVDKYLDGAYTDTEFADQLAKIIKEDRLGVDIAEALAIVFTTRS